MAQQRDGDNDAPASGRGADAPGTDASASSGVSQTDLALEGARRRATSVDARLVRWVLLLGATLAVFAAGALVVDAATSSIARVPVTPGYETTLESLANADVPADTALEVSGDGGRLVFATPADLPLRLLAAAPSVLGSLLLAVGAVLLAGIAGAVGAGRPFDPAVSTRLAGLALLALAAAFVPSAIEGVASATIVSAAGLDTSAADLRIPIVELDVGLTVLALFLAVLDRAVRQGRDLTQETEGLV
jgi:hypothetical protein